MTLILLNYYYLSLFAPTVPSGPVTNLVPVNINPTTVRLSWGPVNKREQNGIILSYNIYYRQNDSIFYTIRSSVTERVSHYIV